MFQLYGGGPLGKGDQWVSWIHRDNLVNLLVAALENPEKYEGVVNGTAPTPTTMNGLCASVAEATNRPNWLPVPGFALKLLLGEARPWCWTGSACSPTARAPRGFEFAYETVEEAMADIVA